jgi:hypothetical protein
MIIFFDSPKGRTVEGVNKLASPPNSEKVAPPKTNSSKISVDGRFVVDGKNSYYFPGK